MKKIVLTTFSFITILLISLVLWSNSTNGVFYKVYSPDKQYSVYAAKYNYENFSMVFPGHSGDASGKVYLYDEVEKKVINSASIAMVWMTGEIQWEKDMAYFKGDNYPTILEPWKLPRPIREK